MWLHHRQPSCSAAHPGCSLVQPHHGWGIVWRAACLDPVDAPRSAAAAPKCTAMLSPPRCATHCIVVIIQHITPGREGAPAKCSKVLWGSIMSGGDLGDLPLLLLLLQLLLTPRMVAEKWPHKKAIKEHKGSEFRAQCEISRKWDICVHGARPAFDMFTRVQ